ncbi:SCO family protein [Pseudogracilibacillus auburnensis]|uniref:SCO family protein n=1 Tax=Pseudogracilibacillus auburnensis TaxID=1494959 RepID=UPI001A95CA3F|nr:SCO family protein [Pseudogracilibacillus auburnensis]MBO1004622.1 SCO family protein [Pseudogracilibacillus auburnensis]
MKKFYIGFISILVLGVAAGIFYLQVIRPGTAELPKDVVMETAFEEEIDFADLPKRARLIEFMYTQCPDVCPVTTLEMSKLKHTLEEEGVFGDEVEFITITIDPKRDTPEVLKEYAGRFEVTSSEDGWLFLTGTDEATKEIADALGFLYRDPGSGEIVHSTYAYFMDEDNNLLEKFTMGEGFDRERAYDRIMRTIN